MTVSLLILLFIRVTSLELCTVLGQTYVKKYVLSECIVTVSCYCFLFKRSEVLKHHTHTLKQPPEKKDVCHGKGESETKDYTAHCSRGFVSHPIVNAFILNNFILFHTHKQFESMVVSGRASGVKTSAMSKSKDQMVS